jgi:hypothetical protein
MPADRTTTIRALTGRVAAVFVLLVALSGFAPTFSSLEGKPAHAGAASVPVCSTQVLQIMMVFNGPGNPYGAMTLDDSSGKTCSLSGRPLIRVVSSSGRALALRESTERLTPALPRPKAPVVLTPKAPWAVVEMDWCGFKSTYNHVDVLFRGWRRPLREKNPPFSTRSFVPPACPNRSQSLLAIDYVRALPGGVIAGTTPVVRVTPSTNLHNGEKVSVSVNGFGIGVKFWLSQCATASDATAQGCGEQLAARPFALTDMSGAGTFNFVVHTSAATKSGDTRLSRPCGDHCVLVVTGGGISTLQYAALRFATP